MMLRAFPSDSAKLRHAVVLWLFVATAAGMVGVARASDASQVGAERNSPPPNILMLLAEDLSSRIGAFGDPIAVTPNLDTLAEEGARFTRVFSVASTCGPSRAALLTGMHAVSIASQHMRTSSRPGGAYKAVPPPHVKAFPEILRANGYYTFTDGKLDYQFSDVFAGSGPFTIWDEEGVADWSGREEGQPFFGLVNFMVTHESGAFPPLGNWPHSLIGFAMQWVHAFGDYDVGEGPVTPTEIVVPPYYADLPVVREDLARLYNNVYQLDQQIGKWLARLEREGLVENTIVIFLSDHGDGLPRAKRSLFDAGTRVPMIIRWPEQHRPPGRTAGSRDSRLVSFVDLAPTILSLAGIRSAMPTQGIDFLSGDSRRERIFLTQDRVDEVDDRQRAIRGDRFKYVRSDNPEWTVGHRNSFRDNLPMMRVLRARFEAGSLDPRQASLFEPIGREQLYDVEADPHELTNLAASPAHREVKEKLSAELSAWLERVEIEGAISEDEMVERNRIDGKVPVTGAPTIRFRDGALILESTTPGASLGYRLGGGPWRLFVGPVPVAPGERVEAKAVRYGFEESRSVEATAPPFEARSAFRPSHALLRGVDWFSA